MTTNQPISPARGQITGPLCLDGTAASIVSPDPVVRIEDLPGLADVRRLTVPAHVRELFGLERFEHLQILEYAGDADLLGFAELLDWLIAPAGNDEKFLTRVAASMRAGRPISLELTAFIAPNMVPPHTLEAWDALLDAFDDVISRSNGYGRQDVCLCTLSGGQLKRLEYALYMGFALSGDAYPPHIARLYRPEDRFTSGERILYGLSLLYGRTYRDFYAVKGEHDYRHIWTKAAYMAYLRKNLALADTAELQQMLRQLIGLGILARDSYQAAVDLLLERRLTEATAFLLDCGRRHPELLPGGGGTGSLDEEFQL